MTHEELIALAAREHAAIAAYARERGISEEEAVTELFTQGLERRVRGRFHRAPCAEIRDFRRGRS